VKRDHVGDEDVSSPSCHHVEVEERCTDSPESASVLESFDPEVESDHQKEDGDGFVIVRPSDGSGNVT